eukprot:XP_001710105.1 Hypothetical protein GL50803_31616 [Giardia lamblia ATCC 50803]
MSPNRHQSHLLQASPSLPPRRALNRQVRFPSRYLPLLCNLERQEVTPHHLPSPVLVALVGLAAAPLVSPSLVRACLHLVHNLQRPTGPRDLRQDPSAPSPSLIRQSNRSSLKALS